MLKERKEKSDNYVARNLALENTSHASHQQDDYYTKNSKLPLHDLQYLNHDFDDRDEFEQRSKHSISTLTSSLSKNKQSQKKLKAVHIPANYDHIQSIVAHKVQSLDQENRFDESQTAKEDASSLTMDKTNGQSAAKSSIYSKNKMERRKKIESLYKDPLERDFMEMLEEDIDELTDIPATESMKNLDKPVPYSRASPF